MHYVKLLPAILALFITTQSNAQQATNSLDVFEPSFYRDGNPVNALDMVKRTPGFTLDGGNSNIRGLEGASGNVLIDSRPPTSKSLSLSELLEQIPFSNVARIELIRGGAPGINMMGHSTVLNVIRMQEVSSTTTAEITGRFYQKIKRDQGGGARLEYAQTNSGLSIDGVLEYDEEQRGDAGQGTIYQSARGSQPERKGSYEGDNWFTRKQASGNLSYQTGDFTTSVNLIVSRTDSDTNQFSQLSSLQGETTSEHVLSNRIADTFEAGIDLSQFITDDLQLNSKMLYGVENVGQDSILLRGGSIRSANETHDSEEIAARLSLRWQPSIAASYEWGAETAKNTLDSQVATATNGIPTLLPNDDIIVSEDRVEIFAETTQNLGRNWIAEFGLNYEISNLTQSGDSNLEKDFSYLKPSATLTWTANESTKLSFRIEKAVGQLNFNTFAASPSLGAGITSGGNASLEPEESIDTQLQIEQSFWDEGSIILAWIRNFYDNALDYIPVGDGFDAQGNLGKATRDFYRIDLSLPFDRLGWEGATFRTLTQYLDSQIDDPVTGKPRYLSTRNRLTGSYSLTWELPQYQSVIGLEAFWGFNNYNYRISERRLDRELISPVSIWWERNFADDLLLHLEIHHLSEQRRRRIREFYAPGTHEVEAHEIRDVDNLTSFFIQLRKSF